MEKFSIIDWLILQTRKDLTYIRRSMEHESVNLAIFADLFIAFVAFSLEHVFRTVNEETGAVEKVVPSVYWIFVSALLFIIPAIIFFVGYRKAYISVFNDLCTEISKNKGYEALQELIIKVNLEKAADGKAADGKAADGKAADEKAADEKVADVKPE